MNHHHAIRSGTKAGVPNIREIARRAGCSASTVSRVLSHQGQSGAVKISEETSQRILEVCAELNYTPSIHASRLFSHRSQVIGFLPPRELPWDDVNLSRSLAGVCLQLSAAGYRCLPLQNDEEFFRQKGYLQIFRRNEIDGLIIWGEVADAEYLHELTAAAMPFILLGNRVADFPAVVSDQRSAMRQLVRHCQEKGARKLVYLDLTGGDSCEQRRQGFLDCTGPDGVILPGGLGVLDGYQAASAAIPLHPDAIIAGNDKLAVGVERFLQERGLRLPHDMMLTGGDNIELSEYCAVPLTTFDQRAADCAQRSVEILLGHLDGQQPLLSATLPASPVFRQSTRD